MGLKFRKSIKIAPGIRMNISKSGIGFSAGVKGARISVNSKGRVTKTVSIPGTGISYSENSTIKNTEKKTPKTIYEYSSGQQKAFSVVMLILGIMLAIMSILLIIGEMTVIGIIGIILAVIFIKTSRSYKKISETKK